MLITVIDLIFADTYEYEVIKPNNSRDIIYAPIGPEIVKIIVTSFSFTTLIFLGIE